MNGTVPPDRIYDIVPLDRVYYKFLPKLSLEYQRQIRQRMCYDFFLPRSPFFPFDKLEQSPTATPNHCLIDDSSSLDSIPFWTTNLLLLL